MATTRDEAPWQELADPEAPETHRTHSGRAFAAKVFGLASLIGATVAFCMFYSNKADHESWVPQQQSQLVGVSTVDKLNNIFATIQITNPEDIFKTLPESQLKVLFQDFLSNTGSTAPKKDRTFQRDIGPRSEYDTVEEYDYRLGVFSKNLLDVIHRNANSYRSNPEDFRAKFGITEFADWTPQDFKFMQSVSGLNMTKVNAEVAKAKADAHGTSPKKEESPEDLSSGTGTGIAATSLFAFSACVRHYPVRNQGRCGDCWAFSTAEVIRMRLWMRTKRDSGVLSAQQLVDCWPNDRGDRCKDGVNGCCGGWPSSAINWLSKTGGISTKARYGPMISDRRPNTNEACKHVPKAVLPGKALFPRTETIMAQWLCEFGAISVAIDATPLRGYTSGLIGPRDCSHHVNHAVLVVGIDTTTYHYSNGAKAPVWIVQNSWGTRFGVSATSPYRRGGGFFLLQWGADTCAVKNYATIPYSAQQIR